MPKYDTHWVRAGDVVKLLDEYFEKHRKRFPPNSETGAGFSDVIYSYGPVRYLADQMTVIQGTFRGNYNKIERVRKLDCEWVSFSIADHILTAMGDVNSLGDEIPIFVRNSNRVPPKPEPSRRIALA